MKKVSIIIVNWNGRTILKNCLDSIIIQNYPSFEVILVDNGSHDDSVSFVERNYPLVKVISLDKNLGFTGGNIAGYERASGDYIVLLNNDARLSEVWLDHMVKTIESEPSIGFCSSKIIIDGTSKIDSAGDIFTSAFTGTKIGEMDEESNYSVRRFVPGACAAAVIYKKEMLDDIGFLDDDFFLNHEDTDLNMRAWLAGWRCMFVPEAVVHHKVSASIGVLSDTSVYYFARNNEWVWLKNVPLGLMIRYFPQRVLYELCSCAFFCLLAGKWRPFLKGKWDAMKGVPMILDKRRKLSKLRRLDAREIRKELLPLVPYLRRQLLMAGHGESRDIEPRE